MSIAQISTSVTILNDGLLGYQAISLTNATTSAASSIAAGSCFEIGGAFFKCSTDEAPNASSWTAITTGTTAYLALTPSGSAGSQIVSAAYTSTAPVWSTSKQGYYASAASVARVIGCSWKEGTSIYNGKTIFNTGRTIIRDIPIGDWNMDSDTTKTILHGITNWQSISILSVRIIKDSNDQIELLNRITSAASDVMNGGVIGIYNTEISLARLTSGMFDSVDYNSTSFNRGWITVEYIE